MKLVLTDLLEILPEAGALYTSWLFEEIGAPLRLDDLLVPGLGGFVIPVLGDVISWLIRLIPSS